MTIDRALAEAVWIAADLHGEFGPLVRAVKERRPRAVIAVGDLQPKRALEQKLAEILNVTEFWFIQGNHDTDSDADHDHLCGSALAERTVHGRVVEIAGLRVAELGGVFRSRVWSPPSKPSYPSEAKFLAAMRRRGEWYDTLPRQHRGTIFRELYEQLARARTRVDLLVTHEAPSANPHGFEAIDIPVAALNVERALHGRHYDSLAHSACNRTNPFEADAVGLRGITDVNGTKIRPGELDRARANRGRSR